MQKWVLDTSSLFLPTPSTCSYFHPPINIHPKSWAPHIWQPRQKARAREVWGAFPSSIYLLQGTQHSLPAFPQSHQPP